MRSRERSFIPRTDIREINLGSCLQDSPRCTGVEERLVSRWEGYALTIFRLRLSDVAEAMRHLAVEVVAFTGAESFRQVADGDLNLPCEHKAGFLCFV